MPCLAKAQEQPLETEEAILIHAKTFVVNTTYEYQTSADGQESALPLAFAYGISNRVEFAVEPVPFTKISPAKGSGANGAGDIEATLTWNFIPESKSVPAFAIAGEVKLPTAKNFLIGTGQTDYTFYLIATKNMGKFETHLNVGYAIIGQPPGIELNNIFNFAAAIEFHANPKLDLVTEVVGNTSSEAQSASFGTENPASPELSGGEIVGMVGTRYYFNPNFLFAFGITYDNNSAILFRPGLTYFLGK